MEIETGALTAANNEIITIRTALNAFTPIGPLARAECSRPSTASLLREDDPSAAGCYIAHLRHRPKPPGKSPDPKIPNRFVVGCTLDYKQLYLNVGGAEVASLAVCPTGVAQIKIARKRKCLLKSLTPFSRLLWSGRIRGQGGLATSYWAVTF